MIVKGDNFKTLISFDFFAKKKRTVTPPEVYSPFKKNKKGLASVILATNSPNNRIGSYYINRLKPICQAKFAKSFMEFLWKIWKLIDIEKNKLYNVNSLVDLETLKG